jgi:UDP-N-acetylmuramate dehydrogenase
MKKNRALEDVLRRERVGEIRLRERLAHYTTMGVGGACLAMVRPPDLESLDRLIRTLGELEVTYLTMGGGSNLLVADEGFDGVVIATDALQEWDEPGDCRLRLGAGVNTARLVRWAACRNLAGLEGLAGVPGTIGGACIMNAGGRGGDISQVLVGVTVVTAPPEVHTVEVPAEALQLAYRSSALPPGSVIGRVELELEAGEEPGCVENRMKECMEHRHATQPKGYRSAGSTFRNPDGDYAGRLIEDCGLKGAREGGARVSEVHANFIVNTGSATAAEVRALIERVRDEVRRQTGVELQLEVVPVGFAGDDLPAMAWAPRGQDLHGGRPSGRRRRDLA